MTPRTKFAGVAFFAPVLRERNSNDGAVPTVGTRQCTVDDDEER